MNAGYVSLKTARRTGLTVCHYWITRLHYETVNFYHLM